MVSKAITRPQPGAGKGRSLVDYVRAKRRESCKVCALPDEIRAQITTAREKGIKRSVIREWLAKDYGLQVSDADFTTHSNARHDQDGEEKQA